MDNLDTQTDNTQTQDVTASAPITTGTEGFSWKSKLGPDLMNAPTMQKFEDTPEGLTKAVTSHLELEKMLGHEKVPIPKGPDDKDGWSRFSKAMGIPDRAEQYGLADAEIPEGMKGMGFDKQKFADVVHSHKLTPGQAKGLWEAYTTTMKESYQKVMQEHQKNMVSVVNQMRSEWGDAYDTNVELGQMVINKFAGDKETEDYITAALAKDPRGIKFLAKVGGQFAENKIGNFQSARFSLSPDQAAEELSKMKNDMNGPYMNQMNKFSSQEHDRAMARANELIAIIKKAQG